MARHGARQILQASLDLVDRDRRSDLLLAGPAALVEGHVELGLGLRAQHRLVQRAVNPPPASPVLISACNFTANELCVEVSTDVRRMTA